MHTGAQQLRGGGLFLAGGAGGDGPVEVTSERRGALEKAHRLGRKRREAQRDGRGDRAGDRVVDRSPARRLRGGEQLLDDERHSLASGLQRRCRAGRQRFADDVARHGRDVVGVEGMQDDGLRGAAGDEGASERTAGRVHTGPQRRDNGDR